MTLSDWGAVATILLAIEGLIVAAVMAAGLYFVIRGVYLVRGKVRPFFAPVRYRTEVVTARIVSVSRGAVAPFISVEAAGTAVWVGIQSFMSGSQAKRRATQDET
jgi:hypothetical protein